MRHIAIVGVLVVAMSSPSTGLMAQASNARAANTARPATVLPRVTVLEKSIVPAGEAGISGTVLTSQGELLRNTTVRARNVQTKEIGGSTKTSAAGDYVIRDLKPGNYVLEIASEAAAPPPRAGQTVLGSSIVEAGEAGISGTVLTPQGEPIRNTIVRARNLLTNEVDGSTRTSDIGEYAIVDLKPGSYVLEIVDDDGQIIGTSAFVAATAGALVSAVTVTATTGVLSAVTSTTGLVAALGATAARGVTAAAAAAGVAGVVVPPEIPVASPSR